MSIFEKSTDILAKTVLESLIDKNCIIDVFDTIDSTNSYAKEIENMSLPHLIVANEQTSGRGRLGRSFHSPSSKGIYMTIAFEPAFGVERALLITPLAAVAVCKAFEETAGVNGQIKWVNDIYIDNKKVCGILTEAESDHVSGSLSKIIVGIGINCFNQEFPEEIKDKATYIKSPQKEYTRNQLIASIYNMFFQLLDNFEQPKLLDEYKSRSMLLGKEILIYGTAQSALPENGGEGIKARALDIDSSGGLVVEYLEGILEGRRQSLTSGEVTIRW